MSRVLLQRLVGPLLCLAAVAGCTAAAPTAAPSAAPASGAPTSGDWQRILDAAKTEGSVLVYQSLFPGTEGTKVSEEFKRLTGVTADFITGSGAPLSQRIRTETKGGQPSADIFEGSPQFLGPMLNEDFFLPLQGKPLPFLAEPAATWKVDPTYLSDTKALLVSRPMAMYPAHVLVNTKLLAAADYPKSYHELMTDPKYKGKVGYTDPKTTGDAAAVFIRQGYVGGSVTLGDFWSLYTNQSPLLFPGPLEAGPPTGRGEVAISIGAYYGSLLQLVNAGAPIKLLAFADAPVVSNPSSMGVLKSGRHPNAALVFVDWYYSKAGQEYITKLLQLPSLVRRDVVGQASAALKPEVVGGSGKPGPQVVLTAAQSQLAAELNGIGVFQKLTEGIAQADLESRVNAYIADWESKHGGPQKKGIVVQD